MANVSRQVITRDDALAASKAQGLLQGEAVLLRRQLQRRFHEIPPQVEKRLELAGRDELETWADRVLDAERLEDVFGSD